MITITVETDQEAADVKAMLSDAWLASQGHSYVIRHGHRSIGGGGTSTVTFYAGSSDLMPMGGGGGSAGTSAVVSHSHGLNDPCPPSCVGYGGGGGWAPLAPLCPYTGDPQFDRDDLDMCSCGHRHITITAYGGGRSEP